MRKSLIIVCLAAACLCVVELGRRTIDFVVSGFRELETAAAAFVWFVLEPVLRSSSTLAYAGPSSIHELRHEAGASRRAAARHI